MARSGPPRVTPDEGMKNDDAFERFVREVEPGLRRALSGHLDRERVPDALAEAFAYAWQHRERVMAMENPSGYLYRVAQSKSRTRRHGWLEWPGEQDVTIDVPHEYLVHAAQRAGFRLELDVTQAEWLSGLGLDDLVDDARRGWDARAHVGDLEAVRHRSRVSEGAALSDRAGLGAHRVLVFRR